jgi:hypothetical protein
MPTGDSAGPASASRAGELDRELDGRGGGRVQGWRWTLLASHGFSDCRSNVVVRLLNLEKHVTFKGITSRRIW